MVQPALDKIDLPHLCKDIKKYNDAGVLNAERHTWWDEFLKTFKDAYGTVNADLPPWPLDALRSAAKSSSTTKEVSVPTVVLNHHQSEKEIPCEVMVLIIANIIRLVSLCVAFYVTGSKKRDRCAILLILIISETIAAMNLGAHFRCGWGKYAYCLILNF